MSNLLERYNPFDKIYGDDLNHIIDAIDAVRYNVVSVATAASGARYVLDPTSFRAYNASATNYGAPSGAGVTFEVSPNGSVFMGGALTLQNGSSGIRWVIDSTSIRGYDGTLNNYGAPSGAGVSFEAGNAGGGNIFIGGAFTIQSASSGARLVANATSLRLYDGTATDYGAPSGVGVTTELKSSDGSAFLSGPVTIQSAKTGAKVKLVSGATPQITVNDGTRDRVIQGKIGSAYDINVIDSSGNLIFDATSLVATLKSLVAQTSPGSTHIHNTTDVTLLTAGFSLSRAMNVLMFGQSTGYEFYDAGYGGPFIVGNNIKVEIVGQASTTGGVVVMLNARSNDVGITSTTPVGLVVNLPAGSYTANLKWVPMPAGGTTTYTSFDERLYVFLLGGNN